MFARFVGGLKAALDLEDWKIKKINLDQQNYPSSRKKQMSFSRVLCFNISFRIMVINITREISSNRKRNEQEGMKNHKDGEIFMDFYSL